MATTINEINFPQMSVDNFVEKMTPVYTGFTKQGIKYPAVMLWGSPGVGKSQGIKQIAQKVGEELNRKVHITDVRLLLMNPVDLRGIPTADAHKELCKWLKPAIFQMDDSEDVINFLVLDELTAAPQSVQAAAYQITLDRQIGEHKIPDNCIIISAGNRITDKSVSHSMPKALSNRMTHFEIVPDLKSWRRWAIENKIDPTIIAYVAYKGIDALFTFDTGSTDEAFPTPRSWESVSNYLKIDSNIQNMLPFIEGTVGKKSAFEYRTYCAVFDKLPDIKAILDGKEKKLPTRPDINYALQASVIAYLAANADKITKAQINNLFNYLTELEAEFGVLIAKDIVNLHNTNLLRILMTTEGYTKFGKKFSYLL